MSGNGTGKVLKPAVDPTEWAQKKKEAIALAKAKNAPSSSAKNSPPSSLDSSMTSRTLTKSSPTFSEEKAPDLPVPVQVSSFKEIASAGLGLAPQAISHDAVEPVAKSVEPGSVAPINSIDIAAAVGPVEASIGVVQSIVDSSATKTAASVDSQEDTTANNVPKPSTSSRVINVVLIRHAESEENTRIEKSKGALTRLANGKFPKLDQLMSLQSMLIQDKSDSKLSDHGVQEAHEMCDILAKAKFWETLQPSYIVVSPLQRARETCRIVLGDFSVDAENFKVMECLREASLYESKVNTSALDVRVEEFESWLRTVEGDNVVVVGHSLFFRYVLKATGVMRNVDVVNVTATFNGKGRCKWGEAPKLLYRTSMSKPHPNYYDMNPPPESE